MTKMRPSIIPGIGVDELRALPKSMHPPSIDNWLTGSCDACGTPVRYRQESLDEARKVSGSDFVIACISCAAGYASYCQDRGEPMSLSVDGTEMPLDPRTS